MSAPPYTSPPKRIQSKGFLSARLLAKALWKVPGYIQLLRKDVGNSNGQIESLTGGHARPTTIQHHFIPIPAQDRHGQPDRGRAPTRWHVVSAGPKQKTAIVMLHGIPDSWYMWHNQIQHFAQQGWHVICPDLRGYGQSSKSDGDYHPATLAWELKSLLQQLGVHSAHLITHDRGSVVGDWLSAEQPQLVASYVRGEQHLYYFHECLAPQEKLFKSALGALLLSRADLFCLGAYTELNSGRVSAEFLKKTIAEFSRPGIGQTVGYHFRDTSFHQEWLDRCQRLITAWQCPVLLLQGKNDPKQPFEFYTNLPKDLAHLSVAIVDAGHFLFPEKPQLCNDHIDNFYNNIGARPTQFLGSRNEGNQND